MMNDSNTYIRNRAWGSEALVEFNGFPGALEMEKSHSSPTSAPGIFICILELATGYRICSPNTTCNLQLPIIGIWRKGINFKTNHTS